MGGDVKHSGWLRFYEITLNFIKSPPILIALVVGMLGWFTLDDIAQFAAAAVPCFGALQ